MVEGQGFRFDQEALTAFAESTARLAGLAAEARTGLAAGRELPAGVFGEVGASSGFTAAFTGCTEGLVSALQAVEQGVEGLATAVRGYCEGGLRLDEDAALDLRRTGEA